MYSNFVFKHDLTDESGYTLEITEHHVNSVEADGLGRTMVRFGEFLQACGFDVDMEVRTDRALIHWGDSVDATAEAEAFTAELDTNVVAPEEYCDDTHGLAAAEEPLKPKQHAIGDLLKRYEEAKATKANEEAVHGAHPTIFGIGQFVAVKADPSGPEAGWVEGRTGTIVDTKQDQQFGVIHLVRFPGFQKPKQFLGDRDTWFVINADLQPV